MLLVNTVLTLPHVRYAVARAYVVYIFVIIFSAKIYESDILSISLTYNLRIRTCAESSAFPVFECKLVRRTRTKEIGLVVFVRSSSDGNGARLRFSSAKLLYLLLASARNASYCELLRVSNLKFAHVNIYLRWFTEN